MGNLYLLKAAFITMSTGSASSKGQKNWVHYTQARYNLLFFFTSETILKQLSSHLLSGHFRSTLLQSSHSSQMQRNKLSSLKKCFVYLQSRQRFHLASISPLVLKNIVRDHKVDLEITKASFDVLYVCQRGGKIPLLFFLATRFIVGTSLWSECHDGEKMSAPYVQSSCLFYLKRLYHTVQRTRLLRFCLRFLFSRAWPDLLCTFSCKLFGIYIPYLLFEPASLCTPVNTFHRAICGRKTLYKTYPSPLCVCCK